jgi:hypothetical protein
MTLRLFAAINLLPILTMPLLAPMANAQQAPRSLPFRISSIGSKLTTQIDSVGNFQVHPDRIELHVSRATLSYSEKARLRTPRHISQIQFFLVHSTNGRKWDKSISGTAISLNKVLQPGEQQNLGGFEASIPIDDTVNLADHWLLIQLTEQVHNPRTDRPQTVFSYAHSSRKIFQAGR